MSLQGRGESCLWVPRQRLGGSTASLITKGSSQCTLSRKSGLTRISKTHVTFEPVLAVWFPVMCESRPPYLRRHRSGARPNKHG